MRDEILKAALKAGWSELGARVASGPIERFWNIAMEAAANVCDNGVGASPENGCCPTFWDEGQEACAAAIRSLKVEE